MAIVNGIITLADARKSIYGNTFATAPTNLDTDIERYVEAATPVIENICGPVLPTSRTFTIQGGSGAVLLPYPVNAVTSVTVGGVAVTNYTADLVRGIIFSGAYNGASTFSDNTAVVVVATVGYATTPPHIILATRELVRHMWQIGRQANRPGVADADSAMASVPSGFAVPRRVIELLQPTPRMAGFA